MVGLTAERTLDVADLIQAAETLKQTSGAEAVAALYESWVRQNPDHQLLYAVLFNYSVALTDVGDLASTRACLERALALNPEFLPLYINLGRVLERLGMPDQAVQRWSVMVDKLPAVNGAAVTHKTTALNQIARVLEASNQDAAAEAMLRQSLDIDRDQREAVQHFLALRQRQCEWPVVAPWERVGRNVLMSGISPLSIAAHTDDPMLQLAIAWRYNKKEVPVSMSDLVSGHWAAREDSGSGRLRIGYLSSDLRGHAVGYLTAEIFDLHDKGKVELFAYYCGPDLPDALHASVDLGHLKRPGGNDRRGSVRVSNGVACRHR